MRHCTKHKSNQNHSKEACFDADSLQVKKIHIYADNSEGQPPYSNIQIPIFLSDHKGSAATTESTS